MTLQQLMLANRQLFVTAADMTKAGIQTAATARPLDNIWRAAMARNDVTHLLQPTPGVKERTTPSHRTFGKGRQLSKGKGKGGKGKGKGVKMLEDLSEGVSSTARGIPICFDRNRGKCTRPVYNGRCDFGLRVCCVAKCFRRERIYSNCPKRKQ